MVRNIQPTGYDKETVKTMIYLLKDYFRKNPEAKKNAKRVRYVLSEKNRELILNELHKKRV